MLALSDIADGVGEVAKRYSVRKIDLFGSYAEGRQTEKSDLDLLVEFTSAAVSLLTLSLLRQQLEDKLGIPVDLVHAPLPEGSFLDIKNMVTVYEG